MSVSQSRSFTKFRPSSVDESLFGVRRVTREKGEPYKEFDPPWMKEQDDNQRTRPLLFYCPASPVASNIMEPQSQEAERLKHSNTPQLSQGRSPVKKKNLRLKFSPSFVDESLFGSSRNHSNNSMDDKTSFEPPWVDQRGKSSKPILWDYGSRPSTCQTNRSSTSGNCLDNSIKPQSSRITRSKIIRQNTVEARKPWR